MGFDVISIAVVLGLAILIHEFGHFIVAKLVGVRVVRFSIGFGPKLLGFTRGDTEYIIAAFPLGGYVKMAGDEWGEEHEFKPWEFLAQRPLKRNLIVIAGPVMNVVLAYVFYTAVLAFYGESFLSTTAIGFLQPGTPAAEAGLAVGQEIRSINGNEVKSWEDVATSFKDLERSSYTVTVETATGTLSKEIYLDSPEERDILGNIPPVIANVVPGSPADKAGITPSSRIISVNGQSVEAWNALQAAVRDKYKETESGEYEGIPIALKWQRSDGEIKSATLTPTVVTTSANEEETEKSTAQIGVSVRFPIMFSDPYFIIPFGIAPELPPVLGTVARESPAAEAGIKEDSRILSIDGKEIGSWYQLHDVISEAYRLNEDGSTEGKEVQITWLNPDGEIESSQIKPKVVKQYQEAQSGETVYTAVIGVTAKVDRRYPGLFRAFYEGAITLAKNVALFVFVIYRLITGHISPKVIGGPIEIMRMSAQFGRQGLSAFLGFMAMVNLNLAVVNLLPIPIVDGGHILIYTIEGIRKKRFTVRQMEIATYIGLGILVPLILWVFYNDLSRIEWANLFKVFRN